MKKNIVQDIIPPRKTVRDIELVPKSRHIATKPVVVQEPETTQKAEPVKKTSLHTYEYNEPPKSSRKKLYLSIALVVVILVFTISSLFKSAEIKVTPKQDTKALNDSFRALKNLTTSGLGFQVVSTTKDVEKNVSAETQQKVQKKARGTIVVYNNSTTGAQKLLVNTRFQTLEGLIFRAVTAITVPSRFVKDGKTVAGSAEVVVEADAPGSQYNVGLKDFTIPGFKGDPKYTQIYARSKTEMTGGFSGLQNVVTQEVLNSVDKDLESQLKTSLVKDITSQIPESFILYPNTLLYKFEPATQVNIPTGTEGSTNTATVKKRGTVSGIIFDKASLTSAIISKISPDLAQIPVKISNLDALKFSYQTPNSFDPSATTVLSFNMSGQLNIVWVFDETKFKSELLGLSKKKAGSVISTYDSIKEAWIETSPFWSQTIPNDPKRVTLINTLTQH